MNISGTLNVFRLIRDPSLCIPQSTISTFNHLPIPLSKTFQSSLQSSKSSTLQNQKQADIRAIVLDKDNCFAKPHEEVIWSEYKEKFSALRAAYPGSKLLIVSNTAGTTSDDADGSKAELLERNTGVKVLRHSTKKPGCASEVLQYFSKQPDSGVTHPSQIAVVGDRLFTDVLMANMMGSHAVYVEDGVVGRHSLFAKAEHALLGFLLKRGYTSPDPMSDFE